MGGVDDKGTGISRDNDYRETSLRARA